MIDGQKGEVEFIKNIKNIFYDNAEKFPYSNCSCDYCRFMADRIMIE